MGKDIYTYTFWGGIATKVENNRAENVRYLSSFIDLVHILRYTDTVTTNIYITLSLIFFGFTIIL